MNRIKKRINNIQQSAGKFILSRIGRIRRITAVKILNKFKNKIGNLIIGNIGNISLFKTAFLFAQMPDLFKSKFIKKFSDRFNQPAEFFNLFTRNGKSRRHIGKHINIIAHCPDYLCNHTEKKVFHIFVKRFSVCIKPRNFGNFNGININFSIFRVKGYISHYRRAADYRAAGNIIKSVALFSCDITYIMYVGMTRKHTMKPVIGKKFSRFLVVTLHITLAYN